MGLSYRSKVEADLDGNLDITNLPAGLGMGPIAALEASTEFKYPAYLKAGYACKPNDKWTVEVDIDWLDWSSFDSIVIEVEAPGFPNIVSVRDWDDSYIYAVGVEYALDEAWDLRAGYAYADSPIPNATFIPDIPRNDLNIVSVGVGYTSGNWGVDAAYTAIIVDDGQSITMLGRLWRRSTAFMRASSA